MAAREMTPLLEVRGLAAGHGGREVLAGVDFSLGHGEWLAVVGANGSGKSTLLDVVAGRLAPRAGQVRIGGHALDDDAGAARRMLGYAVVAEAMPPVLTGRQCIAVHAAARDVDADDAALDELVDALGITRWLDDPVAMMSYGTRQKFGIVLALVGAPPLLVLDESFNGLDPASSLVLKRHLRRHVEAGNGAVLLATHALDIVERCVDRALLLDDGRLVHAWPHDELVAACSGAGGFEVATARALASATPTRDSR